MLILKQVVRLYFTTQRLESSCESYVNCLVFLSLYVLFLCMNDFILTDLNVQQTTQFLVHWRPDENYWHSAFYPSMWKVFLLMYSWRLCYSRAAGAFFSHNMLRNGKKDNTKLKLVECFQSPVLLKSICAVHLWTLNFQPPELQLLNSSNINLLQNSHQSVSYLDVYCPWN